MQALDEPLNEKELEELDRFLLDRVPEEEATEDKDEGLLCVSELDGFLTAVVSGPTVVPMSQWLPAVWGDFEPIWESTAEAERVLQLIVRHMNGIAATLMEAPEEFEPMFLFHEVDGKTHRIVDEWCEGYMRALRLSYGEWRAGDDAIGIMLTPIAAFTGTTEWAGHDYEPDEMRVLQDRVVMCVREIHAYWLARREEYAPPQHTVRRDAPRVGRNDPCPCGSGKKYKKCCLN